MAERIRLALVGVGTIARNQHLPALAASGDFELVAAASHHGGVEGLPCFSDLESLLGAGIGIDAVSICTPPQGRTALARMALEAGKHVMLEKPPGASAEEVEGLPTGPTLFASWHSREAGGVEPARLWLADKVVRAVRIVWKEDVRFWHPGQEWIWEAGGLGVFDPGINALSIVTRILPDPLAIEAAAFDIPANRETPIAATLSFANGTAELDFRQTGPQSWDIYVETDAGTLTLSHGGARLALPGAPEQAYEDREYPRLYAHFAALIRERRSDVDLAPLRLVADAFRLATRRGTEPFVY